MDSRIARILGKLAVVRERRIETFGSGTHGFVLAPALSEAEVRALEAMHGIALPEDYRLFLTEAGASGAGPYYGITPPARWGDLLDGDVAMPDWAARPCEWTAAIPASKEAWAERCKGMDEPYQGTIAIASQGCAYYAALVITGPERGRVMYVNQDGGAPFFPENPDFLSWYERWLDELSWGHNHFWYGFAMPGDEAALVAAATTGPRRVEALQAMYRLPALATETAALVALRVRDDDVAVRSVAIGLAAKFALVPALEIHLRRALADDNAGIRKEALKAIIASGLAWHDDARAALADADDAVAGLALRELDKAKLVTVAEVLPLVGRSEGEVRGAALYAAMTIGSPALFDALLPIARAAGDDRHPVALLALLAQVRLGAATPAQQELALDLVLERMARPRGTVGRTAEINGLGAFAGNHPRAMHALVELTRHDHAYHRFEVVAVLGNVGGREAIEVLRGMIDDTAMPRETTSSGSRSTAWSVGENAKKALARLEARLAAQN